MAGEVALRAILTFVAILVGWAASYATGAWPWFGYASVTRSSFGVGPIAHIGENYRGIDVGLETFPFMKGQEVVIEYEAEIRSGSLWFYVYRPFSGELGNGKSVYITESGKGVWTVPVEETGLYKISIDGSPSKGRGRGYDITYTVRWGGRGAITLEARK